MAPWKWLHISDLHFLKSDFESENIREAFKREFFKRKYDLLFITGDIAFKSAYGDATDFIRELIENVGCDLDHTFIVPGNHDFKRSPSRTSSIRKIKDIENPIEDDFDNFNHGTDRCLKFYKSLFGDERSENCLAPCTVTVLPEIPLDIVQWNTCLLSCDDDDQGEIKVYCKPLRDEMSRLSKDRKELMEYLRRAAEGGMPEAMYALHEELLYENETESIEWLRKAANLDYVDAQIDKAFYILSGKYNIEYDGLGSKEKELLIHHGMAGNDRALSYLVVLYHGGYSLPKKDLLQWLSDADANGSAFAPYGTCGVNGERDVQIIKEFCLRAKERGNRAAAIQYASLVLQHDPLSESEIRANLDYLESESTNQDAHASLCLYEFYDTRNSAHYDEKKATVYLEKAAQQKNLTAMKILGHKYLQSSKTEKKGEALLAEVKNRDVSIAEGRAERGLDAYENGNDELAAKLFFEGSCIGCISCMDNLACMLRRGEVCNPEHKKNAVELLCPVISQDGIENIKTLGNINRFLCYFVGFDCDQDFRLAHEVLTQLLEEKEEFLSEAGWWVDLAKADDPEGCLLATILAVFDVAEFPSEEKEHFYAIAKSSYDFPPWLALSAGHHPA